MTITETLLNLTVIIATNLPWIILYFFIGFGPGLIAGMLLANRLFGTDATYMETHQENIKKAAQHNAQWHPSHERWQKK